MKRTILNLLISLFWTAVCCTGLLLYWLHAPSLIPMYIFVGLSLFSLLIPARWYQASRSSKLYERLGVKTVRKLVQDGEWVRSATTAQQPAQRLIRNRTQVIRYLKSVRMYEGYHVLCLVFFTLSAIHAFTRSLVSWGLLIMAGNIIYNIWPMLLQQYTRIRIKEKLSR